MWMIAMAVAYFGGIIALAHIQDKRWDKKYGEHLPNYDIEDDHIYIRHEPYNRYENNDY